MTPKIFVVIFLLTTGFGHIQNQQQTIQGFQGFPLWRKNADVVLKMKEMETKFTKEFLPVMKGAMPIDEEDEASSEEVVEMGSNEEQMETNKMKREIGELMLTVRSISAMY